MSILSGFNNGYCSWFWDKVCGVDIGLYCYDHDAAYRAGGLDLKLKADLELAKGIAEAGMRTGDPVKSSILLAVSAGSYLAVSTIGIGFWAASQIRNNNWRLP